MKIDSPTALGILTGFGVPQSGTTGQILAKVDNTNYNTQWIDASGGSTFPYTGSAVITGSLRVINSGTGVNSLVVTSNGDVYNRGVSGVTTNTFFGEEVGRLSSGNGNTAIGYRALSGNTGGFGNTAVGLSSLTSNKNGDFNTAINILLTHKVIKTFGRLK
jgi:hypothetical protein